MRVNDLFSAIAALALLVLVGAGAAYLGGVAGRPGAPAAPEIPTFETIAPPVAGGLLGFEGLGDRLAAGPWGTVVSIDDATVQVEQREGSYVGVPGKRLVVESAGQRLELELSEPDVLRILSSTSLEPGERVAVRIGDDGEVSLLVIR
ncbi:MAG: hypothetical protein ACSLFM_10555 [Tepidiformaceae bacterium]